MQVVVKTFRFAAAFGLLLALAGINLAVAVQLIRWSLTSPSGQDQFYYLVALTGYIFSISFFGLLTSRLRSQLPLQQTVDQVVNRLGDNYHNWVSGHVIGKENASIWIGVMVGLSLSGYLLMQIPVVTLIWFGTIEIVLATFLAPAFLVMLLEWYLYRSQRKGEFVC